MTAALEIARINLVRTLRDRASLFFVFLFPLIIIVALGATFGGTGTSRMGLVSLDAGPLGDELVAALEDGALELEIRPRASLDELREGVAEGSLELGLLVPPGYDAALRSGESAELTFVARPESRAAALRQGIEAAVAAQAARVRAARLAVATADVDFDAALETARSTQAAMAGLTIEQTTLGQATFPTGDSPFALGAQSQTILFMFLTSMTAATQLILTRQLGVSRRMLATPTPLRAILLGELLGRFAVAMMQGVFIVVASALLFGVSWGDLVAASLVVVLFAFIGTGVAMIVGAVANNPDQAGIVGVVAGLLLGALGGAMVPIEVFQEPISTIARFTPHAWAIDALRDLSFEGAGIGQILVQLGVLVAMAAALVAVGTWALRRALTRA